MNRDRRISWVWGGNHVPSPGPLKWKNERGQQPGQELRSREVAAALASGRLWKVFGKYTAEEGSLAILEP